MALKLKPLDQQVMVITGASSGIGLVTAKTAAARGARVLLVARNEAALAQAVREIEADGGIAAFAVADVTVFAEVEAAAAAAIERFGRIDTWVNDAGTSIYAKLMDTPLDEHEQLMRTNYFGAVHGATVAVKHLREAGGALITVGSVASDMPSPIMGAYAATKHALKAYVQALRIELRAEGAPISVTLIKPSGIDTPVGQHAQNHAGEGEAQIPPPIYDPQLVADAIVACAQTPHREITVGGGGRAQVLFAEHFPALFEWLAPLSMKIFTDEDTPQPRPSNLFASVRAGRIRSGNHASRKTSLYTAAQLNPLVSSALLAAGAVVGTIALAELFRRPKAPR